MKTQRRLFHLRSQLPWLAITWLLIPSLQAETIDFNRHIRPILAGKCFACHGPDADHREADLRLDVEQDAKAVAIVEGRPADSDVFVRINSDDPDLLMPPADSGSELSTDEIALIRRWIEQGAEYAPYWAYVPPRRHPAPAMEDRDWCFHWIDRFVLHRLQQEGLQPSPDADRVTLIRRLSFDLTGLPPSPEAVDAFVSDTSPKAYENVVDHLLASDRYGERMAMYWLDLVRYADTVGYHGDQDHNISPYRDYVIDAFNDDVPFDQFTREQLAGDLLPDAGIDQKIASGYNRLLQTSHEGGVQPKEYLAIYAADRVRNLSSVWMGATMGCAQCHDHKFDPYTIKDFYSTVAFFADIDEAQHLSKGTNSLPTSRHPEIEVLSRRQRQQIAELEAEIASLETHSNDADAEDDDVGRQIEDLQSRLSDLRAGARKTMISVSIKPRPIRVLPRGNWLDDSGPVVQPAVPTALGDLQSGDRRATRLDLAAWLTDVDDGVGGSTARVQVNRFWYLLFGVGIAKTLDDFGGQGEPPVHPELLDNLAVEFYEHGWSVKHMVKLIVMSHAYRQSSLETPALRVRDPDNRLYARQSRFRLPAEMVRDNALAISGLLVLDYGGPSIRPYQPAGYYRHLNFPTREYSHHTDRRQWRRGVYVHWQRQFLHPMLRAFDAPSREECTAQRPRSNTPLAALTLLNDPTFVEAACAFATKIMAESGPSDDARLDFAFRQAVSRAPDAFERDTLKKLLAENLARYRKAPEAAKQLISTGQRTAEDNADTAHLAAWTTVARAILNIGQCTIRD